MQFSHPGFAGGNPGIGCMRGRRGGPRTYPQISVFLQKLDGVRKPRDEPLATIMDPGYSTEQGWPIDLDDKKHVYFGWIGRDYPPPTKNKNWEIMARKSWMQPPERSVASRRPSVSCVSASDVRQTKRRHRLDPVVSLDRNRKTGQEGQPGSAGGLENQGKVRGSRVFRRGLRVSGGPVAAGHRRR